MTYIKKFLIAVLCLAGVAYLLGIGVLVVKNQQPVQREQQSLGDVNGIPFTSIATSSQQTVTNTSSRIFSTTTDAQWILIQNNSAFGIWLSFKNDQAAAVNTGVYMVASSTLELKGENLYRGSIQAVAPGGATALVLVTDGFLKHGKFQSIRPVSDTTSP